MSLQLAVAMRQEVIDKPWQKSRWVLDEVLVDLGQFDAFERQSSDIALEGILYSL